MKKFFYNWVFWKHFVFCFVIWLIIRNINFTPNQASSIGIIGGADGPTAIFITGKIYPYILRDVVLIISLVLYFPVKKIFKRAFKSK